MEDVSPGDVDTKTIEDMRAAVGEVMGLPRAQPIAAGEDIVVDGESEVISVTDTDEIRRFDMERELRSASTPKDDSRIDFECGFYALKDIQTGSGKVCWRLFNADHQECGIKSTPELAEKWFYENTIPGQLAAKKRAT